MKSQFARLCGIVAFVVMALPANGMDSKNRVYRPFRQVAQAIYCVIPDNEHYLKASLSDLIDYFISHRSAYCAPELFWLELQELLVTNIHNLDNLDLWAQVVKGIFEAKIDYKIYLPSTDAMPEATDSNCQTKS